MWWWKKGVLHKNHIINLFRLWGYLIPTAKVVWSFDKMTFISDLHLLLSLYIKLKESKRMLFFKYFICRSLSFTEGRVCSHNRWKVYYNCLFSSSRTLVRYDGICSLLSQSNIICFHKTVDYKIRKSKKQAHKLTTQLLSLHRHNTHLSCIWKLFWKFYTSTFLKKR